MTIGCIGVRAPTPAAPTEGAGEDPNDTEEDWHPVNECCSKVDSLTARLTAALAERDALRADTERLAGERRMVADTLHDCMADLARWQDDSQAARGMLADERAANAALTAERDALRDTVARIEAKLAEVWPEVEEVERGDLVRFVTALAALVSPSPGEPE